MESLIFDTTFLIDFQRERKNHSFGKAHQFLEKHKKYCAFLSIIAYGEYAEGFDHLNNPAFVSVVESFEIVPVTRSVAAHYVEITKALRKKGQIIGANDLWIAATAIDCGYPLVSGNVAHFRRIDGLKLLGY